MSPRDADDRPRPGARHPRAGRRYRAARHWRPRSPSGRLRGVGSFRCREAGQELLRPGAGARGLRPGPGSRRRGRDERIPRVAAVTGAAAGQAPGIVKVRLSGATADVEMLATLLADYAGSGIDVIE